MEKKTFELARWHQKIGTPPKTSELTQTHQNLHRNIITHTGTFIAHTRTSELKPEYYNSHTNIRTNTEASELTQEHHKLSEFAQKHQNSHRDIYSSHGDIRTHKGKNSHCNIRTHTENQNSHGNIITQNIRTQMRKIKEYITAEIC